MFTKEELLVIKDAIKIADKEYIELIEKHKKNRSAMVAYNRKQKNLWMLENNLIKFQMKLTKKRID